MKKIRAILAIGLACMSVLAVGCSRNQTETKTEMAQETAVALKENPIVTMTIKDYGDVTLELYPEKAPNTVNNFVTLVESGFYDDLTFHRIIEGFMIQGGDPDGIGTGGPGYQIPGEFRNNGFEANDLSHTKGVLSMARSGQPNSAGSQFFIMSSDTKSLDGDYAAFGAVTSGIEIIEQLEKVATNPSDKPLEPVTIEKMTVDTNGETVPEVIKTQQ